MENSWQSIVQWTVWTALMIVFFALVAKARKRDLQESSGPEMRMPTYVLIVGIVDILFFTGITVFSNLFPNETVTWATTSTFLFLAGLGGFLVYMYLIQKHQINDDHLLFTSLFGVRSKIAWNEITSVDYSTSLQWFIVETTDKRKYHFSEIMKGIRQFSWAMLDKVGRGKISQRALAPIDRLKAGRIE